MFVPSTVQGMFWFDSGQLITGHCIITGSHMTLHRHEVMQSIVPHAIAAPHRASQRPVPHSIGPHAAAPPVHSTSQRPVEQLIGPHALAVRQSATRSPELAPIIPQANAPLQVARQSPLMHVTSLQALSPMHVAVQSPLVHEMLPHALSPPAPTSPPLQVTLQSRPAQSIVLRASAVEQPIVHDAPEVQSMVPHAFAVAQVMLQFQLGGHETPPVPFPVMLHVIVAKSQLSHVVGHTGASGGAASGVPITQ
jgi:hypothetical protein